MGLMERNNYDLNCSEPFCTELSTTLSPDSVAFTSPGNQSFTRWSGKLEQSQRPVGLCPTYVKQHPKTDGQHIATVKRRC